MAKLKAILKGVKIDGDGESVISLIIPMNNRESVLAVSMMTEKVLDVEITEEGTKP